MDVGVIVVVVVVSWFVLSLLVALAIGRMVRRADRLEPGKVPSRAPGDVEEERRLL